MLYRRGVVCLPRLVIPGIACHVIAVPSDENAWIEALEARTGRTLKPQKRGPKKRAG
jgi:hypothetical protein